MSKGKIRYCSDTVVRARGRARARASAGLGSPGKHRLNAQGGLNECHAGQDWQNPANRYPRTLKVRVTAGGHDVARGR